MNQDLLLRHQQGLLPHLLSNEKVESPNLDVPAIQKLLISAQSFVDQPVNYYDIFHAGRHVILLRALEGAFERGLSTISGVEARLAKLLSAREFDSFESTLFELLVGARYQAAIGVTDVEFLPEDPTSKTPDIHFLLEGDDAFAECKKFARTTDFAAQLRVVVREKVQPILRRLHTAGKSTLVELVFSEDPASVSSKRIEEAILDGLRSGVPVVEAGFTVNSKPINPVPIENFALYPSPEYLWKRYGYRIRGEWFGIVNSLRGQHAQIVPPDHSDQELGMSTWLDEVDWEAAVKWRVTNEKVVWKYKRLAFGLIFKGLKQLDGLGDRTHLHCWYDRDYALGHRQEIIQNLVERMETNSRDFFTWLVFNDTIFDVSPRGNFDLIEHAHLISGPNASDLGPPVSVVFTDGDVTSIGPELTGVGAPLPDIDAPS